MSVHVRIEGKLYRVDEPHAQDPTWSVTPEGGERISIAADVVRGADGALSILTEGRSVSAMADIQAGETSVLLDGRRFSYAIEDPRSLASRRAASGGAEGPKNLVSPMPGRVVRILAERGSNVAAKQGVLVVEAMKMQNEIKSPKDGVVSAMLVQPGDTVSAGQTLATIT